MLEGVQGIAPDLILAGIIWSLALGFAAGNYACSLVHRLPRGRGVLAEKPYCGNCLTPLATKDLFPVVSALLLRHKCRYCGAPIPKSHFWTEVLVGLLFVLAFLAFNFSEMYVLTVLLGTFLVIVASIEYNEGTLERRVLLAVMVTGMVIRTLLDGSMYGFVIGGFFGALAGALIWRRKIEKIGHRYTLPDEAKLLAVGGICAGEQALPLFLAAFFILWLVLEAWRRVRGQARKLPLTIPFGFAVMVPLFAG